MGFVIIAILTEGRRRYPVKFGNYTVYETIVR